MENELRGASFAVESGHANSSETPQVPMRLRDELNIGQSKKRNCPSDSIDAQKQRNEKKKLKKTNKISWNIPYHNEIDKVELFSKMDKAKSLIGDGSIRNVTNYDLIQRLLDLYIATNTGHLDVNEQQEDGEGRFSISEYQTISAEDSLIEELFVCAKSSLCKLVADIGVHGRNCTGQLSVSQMTKLRHVERVEFTCAKKHSFIWNSSPHVEGGKLLVNTKMSHGFFSSGILPNQYDRFCESAGFGNIGKTYMKTLQISYSEIVSSLAEESQASALREEEGLKIMQHASENGDPIEGIDILTDARHCWRKNACFSDVVCLGNITHRALRVETISKLDDVCSQRHEVLGVKRIYAHLDSKNVNVEKHGHDNNASVTKYVKDERRPTSNAKDTWHVTKGIAREAKKITSGPQKMEGKTWHGELSDKAASIKTHIYWSMKNCEANEDKLQKSILNLVEHYKGNHQDCHVNSRCQADPHYIASKIPLEDPIAEELLTKFLKKLCHARKRTIINIA